MKYGKLLQIMQQHKYKEGLCFKTVYDGKNVVFTVSEYGKQIKAISTYKATMTSDRLEALYELAFFEGGKYVSITSKPSTAPVVEVSDFVQNKSGFWVRNYCTNDVVSLNDDVPSNLVDELKILCEF